MIAVGNVEAKNSFLTVLFLELFGYFADLAVFHYENYVRSAYLAFVGWFFVKQSCRFSFELFVEQLFCCFASVLVLVADKEYFHVKDN